MKLLWLDDYRDPLKNDFLNLSPIPKMDISDVIWVKSYNEFTQWIEKNGLPDGVSFDHDLADEHMQFYFNNGGHNSPPDPQTAEFKEKTGYDCAKWLSEYCMSKRLPLPVFGAHSANPVGRKNILAYLDNFLKHYKP